MRTQIPMVFFCVAPIPEQPLQEADWVKLRELRAFAERAENHHPAFGSDGKPPGYRPEYTRFVANFKAVFTFSVFDRAVPEGPPGVFVTPGIYRHASISVVAPDGRSVGLPSESTCQVIGLLFGFRGELHKMRAPKLTDWIAGICEAPGCEGCSVVMQQKVES